MTLLGELYAKQQRYWRLKGVELDTYRSVALGAHAIAVSLTGAAIILGLALLVVLALIVGPRRIQRA